MTNSEKIARLEAVAEIERKTGDIWLREAESEWAVAYQQADVARGMAAKYLADAGLYMDAASALRRVDELERENAELKAKWRKEECAHCGERPGGHEGTIWCAECLEWHRSAERESDIAADRDAARAEVAGLLSILREGKDDEWAVRQAWPDTDKLPVDLPWVGKAEKALLDTSATAEAYKRRVQAEVYEELAEDAIQRGLAHRRNGEAEGLAKRYLKKAAALREGR